ncbi:hypothetical protein PENARI_c017G05967 [Penicillium arizonense]|uniref:Methyltransferase domain-containing protein n=1 Tax=Penicillium arizonense TaxID=1835702 RepID=A0A1F5LAT8_PENAI|nr:hypothetical protein PENARI_c017G05967 [Penicillium arizonense]OGE50312.1 hypothetical protein PENARI_c017G05967 [Penicillium arizonense]
MLNFIKQAFRKTPAKLYGLDHAVLNIQLPPQSMWMNVGYWEHTNNFPEACEALLEQVVTTALSTEKAPSVRILDVGCGCGDQSLYLHKILRASSPTSRDPGNTSDPQVSKQRLRFRHSVTEVESSSLLKLESYIGITLEPIQAAFGSRRLKEMQLGSPDPQVPAEIFCADAGNPSSWTGELKESITTLETGAKEELSPSTWLLALDTMYHFRPTRLPLLSYAQKNLQANLMAFDLVMADDIPWHQKLLLRVMCWLTNAPFANLVSRSEQAEEGVPYGLKMGKFRVARKMFAWWARGDIVRGLIVVARGKKEE